MKTYKSSFRAAFFLTFYWVASVAVASISTTPMTNATVETAANTEQVARSPIWAALLHLRDGKLQIQDRSFILSFNDFSLEHELLKTIELFSGPDRVSAACRFPARYLWIQGQITLPKINVDACSEFSEYLEKVPADHISLIFASENLSQPSSMMGHIFLKLSGYDAQKKFREHSVSFYTNAATFNLPKLLVENFITGMKGYYALAPYEEALHQYSVVENRSIWDYQLKLDKAQLALLKSHLYELRFVQFKYHFHSYNCASLIKELLVLVEPDIAKNSDLWTTPVDVVKHAQRAKLVAKTGVILSTQWALRSLLEVLPPTDSSDIKEAIEKKKPIPFNANSTAEKKFLMLELAKSYNNILYEQKRIGLPQWRDLNTSLLQQQSTLPKELAIEVSDDANPVNSFEDSQFTAGTLVRANKRYARIGFLPASHTLMDSQLASFNESELKLFELVLLQSLDGKDLTIDKFTLYSTRSLAPWTKVVGGISGGVKFAYENQLDQHLSSYHSLAAVGDAGFAKVIGRDITVYALAGGGVGLHRDHIFVQAASTIGVVVRELAGMKSIISIEKNWNPVGNSGSTRNLNAAQKISVTKQHAFEFAWKKTIGDSSDAQVVESSFLYKYTF